MSYKTPLTVLAATCFLGSTALIVSSIRTAEHEGDFISSAGCSPEGFGSRDSLYAEVSRTSRNGDVRISLANGDFVTTVNPELFTKAATEMHEFCNDGEFELKEGSAYVHYIDPVRYTPK